MASFRIHARWLVTLSLLLLVAFGCETIVEIDASSHEPVLAVRSFFSPDQTAWEVEVRRTVPLNDTVTVHRAFVANATVEIIDGDGVIATLSHQGDGRYVGDGPRPEAEQAYTLRVRAPGYEMITATSHVPGSIPGLTATFTDSVGMAMGLGGLYMQAAIEVRFTDPADRENFYQVSVIRKNGRTAPTLYAANHPALPRESFRETIRSEGVDLPTYVHAHFTDATFDGQAFAATLRFNRQPVYAYRVRLTHLSEAYYRYVRSLALLEGIEDNPFAEPVVLFSNVEGGTGVFAGYSVQDAPPIVLDEITPSRISGHYEATELRLRFISGTVDVLREGGHLEMTLAPNQTVTGHLIIPAGVHPGSEQVNADLRGTYSLAEGTITFQ